MSTLESGQVKQEAIKTKCKVDTIYMQYQLSDSNNFPFGSFNSRQKWHILSFFIKIIFFSNGMEKITKPFNCKTITKKRKMGSRQREE